MNAAASRQLAALARVVDSFERSGIDYSLFGGWAVDFHAGRVTRDHDDIDVGTQGTERCDAWIATSGMVRSPASSEAKARCSWATS